MVYIDFDLVVYFKVMMFFEGVEKIWSVLNVGGNFVILEVFFFEIFYRCFYVEFLRVRRVFIEVVCIYMYIFKVLILERKYFIVIYLFCFFVLF